MKQSWQRIPGLDESTIALNNSSLQSNPSPVTPSEDPTSLLQTLKSEPFEAYIIRRAGLESRLASSGFVHVGGKKVDTSEYIRKGIKPRETRKSRSNSQVAAATLVLSSILRTPAANTKNFRE
jgi:hypothetical protein